MWFGCCEGRQYLLQRRLAPNVKRERSHTTEMMLAAKFPGSSMGRKRLCTGQVWTAARRAVVVVMMPPSAPSMAGGVVVVVGLADGVLEDEAGSLRVVSCAACGKLRLAGVDAGVGSSCWAYAAECKERKKCMMRVRISAIVLCGPEDAAKRTSSRSVGLPWRYESGGVAAGVTSPDLPTLHAILEME